MYYKISSKSCLSPLKITINMKESENNRNRKNDLRIYISSNTKEPNEHNNQKMALNVIPIQYSVINLSYSLTK